MTKKKSGKTKKVGSAGKFGARYGRRVKVLYAKIEDKCKAKHKCPQCGKVSVRRQGYSLWHCTKCGYTFAGGAYIPETDMGKAIKRGTQLEMLEEFQEEKEED